MTACFFPHIPKENVCIVIIQQSYAKRLVTYDMYHNQIRKQYVSLAKRRDLRRQSGLINNLFLLQM